MKKACVIGWPISHSRSPLIHGHWLTRYGITGSYERVPVEPGQLTDFIGTLTAQGYSGCNVTIPHKDQVFQLVKPADDTTERLGAVNTVFVKDGDLQGTNTDGEGFINSISSTCPAFVLTNKRAVLLGAGGAAMAVAQALLANGIAEIAVANRSPERAGKLRERLGSAIKPVEWSKRSEQLPECDLLVNTTSLGMKGQDDLKIDLSRLGPKALVSDIVYVPLRTPLLIEAAVRGNPVVEGLGMLLHQAVRGFELWFGVRPSVTSELHDLIARDIDPEFSR